MTFQNYSMAPEQLPPTYYYSQQQGASKEVVEKVPPYPSQPPAYSEMQCTSTDSHA